VTALAATVLISGGTDLARGPDPAAAAARMMRGASDQSEALGLMAPIHILWAMCGILGGLALREQVPLVASHSSPTGAWFGKRAIAASVVACVSFALGALRVDPGWMHAAAALHALGWLVYLRNLPARL